MAKSQFAGSQIKDGTITRDDINVTTAGKAVVTKLVDGNNGIKIDTSTGADAGTGDVSIKVDLSYLDTKYPSLSAIKTQNLVFASPSVGSGPATFRVLTSGDIPDLPYLPINTALPRQGLLGGDINSIRVTDTRNTNPLPSTDLQNGVWFDFKSSSAIGISGAGIYSAVMTMVPFENNSGNLNTAFRLAQGSNKLFFQNYSSAGNWGTWNEIYHTGNLNPWVKYTSGIFTGVNAPTPFSILNNNVAQNAYMGGLLISNQYADNTNIPVNGAYIKGSISTGSHGNSLQWFTAFGWGNHATAGYVATTQLSNYYTKNEALNLFVGKNGVETISDTKTFSNSPIVPTGTIGTHAINKNQLESWVSQNYMSTSHVANAITLTDINNWGNIATYGIKKNVQFSSYAGAGLMLADDYNGGEAGLFDELAGFSVAIKKNGYYKYGSQIDAFEGINYDIDSKNVGIGRAPENEKLEVADKIWAGKGFIHGQYNDPNFILLGNGNVLNRADLSIIPEMIDFTGTTVNILSENKAVYAFASTSGTINLPVANITRKGQKIDILKTSTSGSVVIQINGLPVFNLGWNYKYSFLCTGSNWIFTDQAGQCQIIS